MMREFTLLALGAGLGWSQSTPPAVIWDMRIENRVVYWADTADVSKLATSPANTPPAPARTFANFMSIADIVSVNGRPVKGAWTIRAMQLSMSPNPAPGQAIADTTRANHVDQAFEILQADGKPIGTLFALGLSAGVPPPGAPLIAANTNGAIVGGTGAFLGIRGQQELVELIVAEHQASMIEDPANRRTLGGGAGIRRLVFHLIPMSWPEVMTAQGSPGVFHNDFSLVTPGKPARAGETLIVMMTNLGPTVPGIDPGQSFPTDRILEVNSPVEASVNGKLATVINKIGWPGLTNAYRLDVRVPDGTATGTALLQITAAFIPAPEVRFAVQ
jgi:hypothetical protein